MNEYIVKCNKTVGISGKTLIVPDYIDTSKEIVRCRDCKYWATEARWFGYCVGRKFDPNGFCKWGERKESGDEQ